MTAALFVLAAGFGAVVRHRVNVMGHRWLGTLAVNMTGSFLLGWFLASDPSESAATVIGTGLLGSLTTYSMFSLEATEGTPHHRVKVVTATLVLGLLAATAGHQLG